MRTGLPALVLLLAALAFGQPYDHVTVTTDSFVSKFAPLGRYLEEQLGLSDTTVTVEYICANYPGRDDPEKVRNFIRYAYSDWGTTHVLLGGDVEVVPCRRAFVDATRYIPQLLDSIPADLYYSDLDGDWDADCDGLFGEPEDCCDLYPDLFVGRLPATRAEEADLLVAKFLAYTADPAAPYLRNVLLSGFDILEDVIFCETTMELYDSAYVPDGMKPCAKVYDSHTGNHETEVASLLNQGQHVWIHADHCNYWAMGMGYVNHGYLTYRNELAVFTNAGEYTIMTSLGCMTGMFDTSDCASEVFMLNPNGGGLAVASNSRYSLSGSATNPQRECSFVPLEGFVRRLFVGPDRGSLEAISGSWADVVPLADTCPAYRWCLFAWNLLGEAAMPVWVPSVVGVEESRRPRASTDKLGPTVVRGVLHVGPQPTADGLQKTELLDAAGRKVMDLRPGENSVAGLPAGVYYVSAGPGTGGSRVIILKEE